MEESVHKEEDRAHLLHSVSPNSHHRQTPLPSQTFPLLRLPREIRDLIYSYALLRPRDGPDVGPTDICGFYPRPRSLSDWDWDWDWVWDHYWGTENFSRLFLVSRQVSYEARKLFYSTFLFEFSHFLGISAVSTSLQDYLSPWTRSLIRRISLTLSISVILDKYYTNYEHEARQAIETMLGLLSNIKWVTLTLWFSTLAVPNNQTEDVVTQILEIMSPLRGFTGLNLELCNEGFLSPPQIRIFMAVREGHDQYRIGRA